MSKSRSKQPDLLRIKKYGDSTVLVLTKEMRDCGFREGVWVKAKASAKEIVITPLKGVV